MVKWESAEARAVFLVDPRWLHLSSSKWTTSSTLCAERKKHTYSSEIHWCYQAHNTYWSGCLTRKEDWRLSECRFEQAFVRLLGERIHKIHSLEREGSKGIFVVWEKRLKQIQTTTDQNREKQEWAKEKPKLDTARRLWGIYFIDLDDKEYPEILKNVENWKDLWLPRCRVKDSQASRKRMQCRKLAMKRSS